MKKSKFSEGQIAFALKQAELGTTVWTSQDFMDNPTRRHSTLGYVSPIAFEKAREA